jgi:phosphatidate phosphatase APP1
VGDNGQHDPEIYSRIAHLFPGRVKAIYIRTIRKQKDERMLKIMADLEKIDVQIVFTPDTINAAQHAQSNQLIAGEEVEKIIAGSSED